MVNNKNFYQRLKKLIRLSNKSFNQVEKELGYPRNSLHNYSSGVEPLSVRLMELSHYFQVSPEYLLGMSDEPKSNIGEITFNNLSASQKIELCVICLRWLSSCKE